MKFRCGIYGVLIERGRVLVCETRIGNNPSFINFPGGGIEPGEAPLDALHREFREEAGLVIKPKAVVHASLEFHQGKYDPQQQLVGMYWRVQRVSGAVRQAGNGDDVVRVFWAPVKDLKKLPFTSYDAEAVAAVTRLSR